MLTLITGQPGNGKTLHCFSVVEKIKGADHSRAVFYSGIPECRMPWVELDEAANWHQCPDGSIVVIDECQRIFPPRKQGAQVPETVRQFETHRHRGFDVVLITQHPQLLDIAVRKLVGRHIHMVRKFGREVSTALQWERCVDPNDRAVQKEALRTKVPFDKNHFQAYRSAEIHTVKKDFPVKPVAVLVGAVLGIGVFGWFAYAKLRPEKPGMVASLSGGGGGGAVGAARGATGAWSVDQFEERIPGVPYSAPVYAAAVKVADAPMVAGCGVLQIGRKRECRCNDQQGNELVMDAQQCYAYFERGAFNPRGVEDRYPKFEPYAPALAPPMRDASVPGGAGGVAAAPAAIPADPAPGAA